jgi:hypothetical protein
VIDEDKFRIVVGNTRTPLSRRLYDDGLDNDLTGATVTLEMWAMLGNQTFGDRKIEAGACTVQPTIPCVADVATETLTANAHGLRDGWEVIPVSTLGGLTAGARYFVRDATQNTFRLCVIPNGPVVNITAQIDGIKVLGQVQYAWDDEDVDTAGRYRAWFTVVKDGKSDTFPNDERGMPVEIAALPVEIVEPPE